MITTDIQLVGLPVRQKASAEVFSQFALSTDEGANLADDDMGLMEVYNGTAT